MNKLKKGIVSGMVGLAGMMGNVGCAVGGDYQNRFWTCNRWVDSNMDGVMTMNEFVGIKSDFKFGEEICVYGKIVYGQGLMGEVRVINNNGGLLDSAQHYIQTNNFCMGLGMFNTPVGEYVGSFHVNGQTVGVTHFRVRD
jgi:hypothetical protein